MLSASQLLGQCPTCPGRQLQSTVTCRDDVRRSCKVPRCVGKTPPFPSGEADPVPLLAVYVDLADRREIIRKTFFYLSGPH
jgi:hypothetical protein